jgi:hypothetical protein
MRLGRWEAWGGAMWQLPRGRRQARNSRGRFASERTGNCTHLWLPIAAKAVMCERGALVPTSGAVNRRNAHVLDFPTPNDPLNGLSSQKTLV